MSQFNCFITDFNSLFHFRYIYKGNVMYKIDSLSRSVILRVTRCIHLGLTKYDITDDPPHNSNALVVKWMPCSFLLEGRRAKQMGGDAHRIHWPCTGRLKVAARSSPGWSPPSGVPSCQQQSSSNARWRLRWWAGPSQHTCMKSTTLGLCPKWPPTHYIFC